MWLATACAHLYTRIAVEPSGDGVVERRVEPLESCFLAPVSAPRLALERHDRELQALDARLGSYEPVVLAAQLHLHICT